MRFFKNKKDLETIEKVKARSYADKVERDALLAQIEEMEDLTLDDVGWMATARDGAVRARGLRIIAGIEAPGVLEYFLNRWPELNRAASQALARSFGELAPQGWERDLHGVLSGKNDKLRKQAEDMLRSVQLTPAIRTVMMSYLPHATGEFRRQLLARLLENPDANALRSLQSLLTDPDEEIRAQVVHALARAGEPRHLKVLSLRLAKETYYVQQALISAFLEFAKAGQDVTPFVLPLLATGNAPLRQVALKILTHLPDPKAVITAYIRYAKSLERSVRAETLSTLSAFENDWLDPVLHLLNDSDPQVRFAAAGMLKAFGQDDRVEPALLRCLDDPDLWVRIQAAEVLGSVGTTRAVPRLVRLLSEADLRPSALDALSRIGDPKATAAIAGLLTAGNENERIEGVHALARLGTREAAGYLKRIAMADPSLHVREQSVTAIQTIGARRDDSRSVASVTWAGIGPIITKDDLDRQPKLVRLLLEARSLGASDIHISVDRSPSVRISGKIMPLENEPVLTAEASLELIRPLLDEEQARRLQVERSVEMSHEIPGYGRYRGSVFVDRKGVNAAFRLIPLSIPTIADIGLPPQLSVISQFHQGLVLVVGPSGSGKTTTLAALVDLVNETRQRHIISIEDPIEYVHYPKCSLVNQREIGRDTYSYSRALRGSLREDPDVIVLSEMRDAETVRLALEAAETGHLVMGTINGKGADRAVDRLINNFAPEEQGHMRNTLSDTLRAVIAQSLIPRADNAGLVAVFEVLMGLPTVAAVIRENKTHVLTSLMQTGRELGMKTADDSLSDLLDRGIISAETAYLRARSKDRFENQVSKEFLYGALV